MQHFLRIKAADVSFILFSVWEDFPVFLKAFLLLGIGTFTYHQGLFYRL